MDPIHIVQQIGDAHPAWQDSNVGDEGDVAHELLTGGPGVLAEHFQFSFEGRETKDRVERGGFAGAVRTYEPEDATFLDAQINSVQRRRSVENFAESTCFNATHG